VHLTFTYYDERILHFFVQQGQTVPGGIVDQDSGPVFDKTPIGNVCASGIFLSKLECAHALRTYLCSKAERELGLHLFPN
jgi:hypothetical protein